MKTRLGLPLLLTLLLAGPALGQSKTGTTVGAFMGIEPGARIAGMGNAGVALTGGIDAVYYNPAAIGSIEGAALQFTHSAWFADITFDYAAGALPIGTWGTAFASLTALSSGDIEVRTVDQPLGTGEFYSVDDLALGLGFGRQITRRFAAGAQLNWVHESIWNSTMSLLSVNVGTVYRLTESGLRLGASLSNFGTQGAFDGRDLAILYDEDPDRYGDNSSLPGKRLTDDFPVPVLFRVGLGMPLRTGERSTATVALDAFHPSDNTESLSLGGEWAWRNTVAVRLGAQNLGQEDSETGLTLGLGLAGTFGQSRFRFDYAWADHKRLQETHRMTFAVDF